MKEFSQEYYKLLTEDYAGINLTRITDYSEFYNKQIIDSVEPYVQSTVFAESLNANKLMIDVGFGGGFPILPMAFKINDCKFVGVETRAKKANVVGEIATRLGLENVKLHHNRIENILIDIDATVTFKAVGKVYDFLSKINTTRNIQVFFYKGPNFYELEADQLKKASKEWELIEEKEIMVPEVEKRYLIGFKNKNVPHGTGKIKTNNLVKLSDIL